MAQYPKGELKPGEYHPAADSAMRYIKSLTLPELYLYLESFSSCAIEGNRLSELCAETLQRLIDGKAVSDRYLLALAWTIRYGIKDDSKKD